MKKDIIDIKSLFLGSKSENKDMFGKMIDNLYNEAAEWRKNFHANDPQIVHHFQETDASSVATKEKVEDVLTTLSNKMRSGALPWHSPRYLAHMNSETLMPGIMAYFYAMFYNSNNVAYESSPATSWMESEVGKDFCKLLGYDHEKGWGHICADGSIANFEGLWYARNLKSIPLAIKDIMPSILPTQDEWELLNLSNEQILDILDKNPDQLDVFKNNSARGNNKHIHKLGKVLVPRTKHYSWLKAADIMGVGTESVISIDIDEYFRMDIDALEKEIRTLVAKKIPILAVVSVVGTTEEGQFDYADKVSALRMKLHQELGIWFYFHIDAAFGGYVRSIFLDENQKMIPYEEITKKQLEYKVFTRDIKWMTREKYNAFAAMGEADSITIDPHKMGYAPYAAGGIAIKDIRMRNAISYFATYVFDTKVNIPDLLGAYMIEGSKAGATAAAVWTNHQVLPLNVSGYGKLIGHSVEAAYSFYDHLEKTKSYQVGKQKITVTTLIRPDFNMVDFVLNYEGNTSLEKMNDLNQKMYSECSFVAGDTYKNDLLLSHTSFSTEDYGTSPISLLKRVGINVKDFNEKTSINILRSCIMSPWLNHKKTQDYFYAEFDKSIINKLSKILK